jgi:hypothetical protein
LLAIKMQVNIEEEEDSRHAGASQLKRVERRSSKGGQDAEKE